VRRRPGRPQVGTTGTGSSQQLATWQLILAAGLPKMGEVPYQGSMQAHPDLIAGRLALMIDPAAAIATQVRNGKVKGLAVTTPKRLASLPDVPTLEEAGLKGVDLSGWGGLFAPAGTPPAVLQKLSADLTQVLGTPEVQARFEQMGLVAAPTSAEEFQRFVQSETQRWGKVVAQAGIPVQ
jgi:tripartite-type tricarboxylate transporter receptor subunit TctC